MAPCLRTLESESSKQKRLIHRKNYAYHAFITSTARSEVNLIPLRLSWNDFILVVSICNRECARARNERLIESVEERRILGNP